MRSYIEHGMASQPQPIKLFYFITAYRYEKVQKGRYREHHQFGTEMFGAAGPEAEAELISLISMVLDRLGVKEVSLNINSIGCPECRKDFHAALKSYLADRLGLLCETCRDRFERNPMRILDCKEKKCGEITADAPTVIQYLCGECEEHFEKLKKILNHMNIDYNVNPKIVRGLDYYTKTVFEFVSNRIGAQGTVCGGGRYDRLVEQCGGSPTPGLGFGMGMERLLFVIENSGFEIPPEKKPDIFIASIGDKARESAVKLLFDLRSKGISAQMDLADRSLKAQMKYADKLGARLSLVLGEDEVNSGTARLRDMQTGEENQVKLQELAGEIKR